MLVVDGSMGGGSILRISVPIAIAKEEELKIINIRKKRSQPGLKQQHLQGVQLLAALTGSRLEGARVGSSTLEVYPHQSEPTNPVLEIPTAGAVSLVFQLLSNYVTMSNQTIHTEFLGGGTHTQWSPNFDYLQYVTLPALQLFGQKVILNMTSPGYYPKGGASGKISIESTNLTNRIDLSRNMIEESSFTVISRATNTLKNAKVAERQLTGLQTHGINPSNSKIIYDETSSVGSSLTVIHVKENKYYKGFSALGKKGLKAEEVGSMVSKSIQEQHPSATVDEYLADQLMLPLSQAVSGSIYSIPRLTNHVTSNLELINNLLDHQITLEQEGSYYLLQKN